jgi:hypothetical protein
MEIKTVKKPSELYKEIEVLVQQTGLNYLDAIIAYSEQQNIEVEVLASLIKKQPKLKAKLEIDCEDLNLLERYQD